MSLQRTAKGPSLEGVTTEEAMHSGVLTCPPETPLHTVARMMAKYRVHSIVVSGDREDADGESWPWGIVSDLDLADAIASGDVEDRTAGGTASGPLVTVYPDTNLVEAAALIVQTATAHLLVVDPASGRPVGILSTLDLAAALADGRAQSL